MSSRVLKQQASSSGSGVSGRWRRGAGHWINLGRAWPWATSTLVHAGLLAVGLAVFFTIRQIPPHDDTPPIIIPSALLRFASESGPAAAHLPAQSLRPLERPPNSAGLPGALPAPAAGDPAKLLGGSRLLQARDLASGAPPFTSSDPRAGQLAPFGTPQAAGDRGPRTTFFGTSGNATRVVYILDHSGGMLDHLSFLEDEVSRSVRALMPVQRFAVILVSDRAGQILPQPNAPPELSRATPANCEDILTQMKAVAPAGLNDGMLTPFDDAFKQAFDLHPQLIYFLTDGQFDPRLLASVARLNAHHAVHINTIAFARRGDQRWTAQLAKLARDNGGVYRALSDDELEK